MVEHSAPEEGLTAQAVFGDLRWADWADMEDDDCDKAPKGDLRSKKPRARILSVQKRKQRFCVCVCLFFSYIYIYMFDFSVGFKGNRLHFHFLICSGDISSGVS